MIRRALAGALLFFVGLSIGAASGRADSPKTVALLISLDLKASVPEILWWRYAHYEDGLEKEFRAHFKGKGYNLVVQHDADQFALWQTLHSSDTLAVFWVSHAGFADAGNPGTAGAAAIVDRSGFDVAPVFRARNPRLRFLGVVGCDSEKVLDADGEGQGQGAVVFAFSSKTDAKKGLSKAMTASDATLATGAAPVPCSEWGGVPVEVTRRNAGGSPAPAARIEWSGRALAVLPAQAAGESQTAVVLLPLTAAVTTANDLKHVLTTGDQFGKAPSPATLGTLELSGWSGALWKVFAGPDGHPLGITQNLYHYEGALPANPSSELYRPYACE
jgi:hypothetical protein